MAAELDYYTEERVGWCLNQCMTAQRQVREEKEIYKRLSRSWLSDTEMCEIRGETSSLYTQRKSKYRIAYQSPSIPDVPQKAIA